MDCWLNVENHIESQQQQLAQPVPISEGEETDHVEEIDASNQSASTSADGGPQQQLTPTLPGSQGEQTKDVHELGASQGAPGGKQTSGTRRNVHFTPSTDGGSEDGNVARRRRPALRQRSAAKRAALRSQQYY